MVDFKTFAKNGSFSTAPYGPFIKIEKLSRGVGSI
jgi:hypothetical protein